MAKQGYFRFPAIHSNNVFFVAEDDVWTVSDTGGIPRRLTSGLGEMGKLAVSPDGQWLAVTAREEKHAEVYVTPTAGGPLRRLTYLGVDSNVRGFSPNGEIIFNSNSGQPFLRMTWMFRIPTTGGHPQKYPFGRAHDLSFGPGDRSVIGRNTTDLARWKRYRGGTAGRLWVDLEGSGQFRPLLTELKGNLANPMWIGDRIFFLSDHEGIGNLYSSTPSGQDVRRLTDHEEYFARWAYTDGKRIVYQSGANIYLFDPPANKTREINMDWHGPATQTQRKFIKPEEFVENCALHPDGHSVAVECRGKALPFGLWEGPVSRNGDRDDARYRQPQWLHDGKTMVCVSDGSGEERLEVFRENGGVRRLEQIDLGRVAKMSVCPKKPLVAISNHRQDVLLVDVETETVKQIDHSGYRRVEDLAWSPDGNWLAYDFATSRETSAIKLHEVSSGRSFLASTPEFRDFCPAFDPEGKFLYFLSHRSFDPVYDSYYFDLGFPKSIKPCLIVLSKDEPSPFWSQPRRFVEPPPKADTEKTVTVRIDAEGIERRILAFPVPEGLYRQIGGLPGKALFTSFPLTGSLRREWPSRDLQGGDLQSYEFNSQKTETLLNDVGEFQVSGDNSTLLYISGERLRVVNAAAKIEKPTDDRPSRHSGWIDLNRLRISIQPRAE